MKINWKETEADEEIFWCIIRGVMCYKHWTGHKFIYYTASCPNLQYLEESELTKFLDRKHRAA